ncbi:MAG: helix-turn-helix domain-containing protein [Actinomycetota bacterium]|nr:helix-turn-helix domain-containing protein [Actinomycetota bacterium]
MAVGYREIRPPDDLRAAVVCLWERVGTAGQQLVVPDGCTDLIWLAGRELVIAGADTGARSVSLPVGLRSSGLRLRPGAAGGFLGVPASEVRDCRASAEEVLGSHAVCLADRLASTTAQGQLQLLAETARRRQVVPDPVVIAASRLLGRPGARVATVASDVGISERQLHRRTVAAVGYGPKMLARVLRLRRLIRMPAASLVERALAAGYASQAHMSDEVRSLTGLSASQYLVRFVEAPTLVDL